VEGIHWIRLGQKARLLLLLPVDKSVKNVHAFGGTAASAAAAGPIGVNGLRWPPCVNVGKWQTAKKEEKEEEGRKTKQKSGGSQIRGNIKYVGELGERKIGK
jgi:hypothetical protein